MNCLILSSADSPQILSELQEVSNQLSKADMRVILLTAKVSALELYRVLEKAATIELVWVAGHATREGFSFGEESISTTELGLFLSQAGTVNLVLNTCFGANQVTVLQRYANVNIIASIENNIEDTKAWASGIYLIRRFADTKDLRTAFNETLGSGFGDFRWYPALRLNGKMTDNNRVERLEATVTTLNQTVERLVRALQGDEFSRQQGLIELEDKLEERLDRLEKEYPSAGSNLVISRATAILLGILFFAAVIGLIYTTWVLGGRDVGLNNLHSLYLYLTLHLADIYKLFRIS